MRNIRRAVFGSSWWRAAGTIALLLAIAPMVPPVAAAQNHPSPEALHSGTIIVADAKRITLEEVGPWTAKEPGLIRRSIELTPATKIDQVARAEKAAPGHWPGGFAETPMTVSDLHPGEYATIASHMERGRLVAGQVTIVRLTPAQEGTKR